MTLNTNPAEESDSAGCHNLTNGVLYSLLRNYLVTSEKMAFLGYPVESVSYPGHAFVYKAPIPSKWDKRDQWIRISNVRDVNARKLASGRDNTSKRNYRSHSGSPNSNDDDCSSNSDDRDSDKDAPNAPTNNDKSEIPARDQVQSGMKRCDRCGTYFYLPRDGTRFPGGTCVYHWGRIESVEVPGKLNRTNKVYSCCKENKDSKGCTTNGFHVWSGLDLGMNGPLGGFVKTKLLKDNPSDGDYGAYSMDCEMCYTTQGLEVTKITVVSMDGRTVYDTYVRPENAIIDYNTRISGVTAKHLETGNSAKCLREVQNDLMAFVNADTILVGHGLEHDLKVLHMIHSTVIDTAVLFPHPYGLPYKKSLRTLVKTVLERDIQSARHDSFEDAKACVDLLMWKIEEDMKSKTRRKQWMKKC